MVGNGIWVVRSSQAHQTPPLQLRILAIYLILFLLSFTQTICLFCDILFIFWSLKEEADIECHKKAELENKRYSTKLTLLARFLPCCFRIPTGPSQETITGGLALQAIQSESDSSGDNGSSMAV